MGKRARRKRARRRRRPAPSPPPPPGTLYVGICRWLGHFGIISVLFETPSGFAVLHYDGVKLFRRNALEYIWSEFIDMSGADKAISFKEFQIFEDNASAINSDGVCSELAEMIKRSLRPGQKLAVGKQEYKDIIEASLGIHCLFDEAVLEVMWGLKNLIKMLVPDEKLELTNEDRLQISRGMKSVLDRHCVEVDANLMLSRTEAEKLVADADRYEDKLNKRTCLDMYQKIVWGYGIRYQALAQLGSMVKEAKKGLKLHQGPMVKEAE